MCGVIYDGISSDFKELSQHCAKIATCRWRRQRRRKLHHQPGFVLLSPKPHTGSEFAGATQKIFKKIAQRGVVVLSETGFVRFVQLLTRSEAPSRRNLPCGCGSATAIVLGLERPQLTHHFKLRRFLGPSEDTNSVPFEAYKHKLLNKSRAEFLAQHTWQNGQRNKDTNAEYFANELHFGWPTASQQCDGS